MWGNRCASARSDGLGLDRRVKFKVAGRRRPSSRLPPWCTCRDRRRYAVPDVLRVRRLGCLAEVRRDADLRRRVCRLARALALERTLDATRAVEPTPQA